MPKKAEIAKRMKTKKYGLRTKAIKGVRPGFSKGFEAIIVSDKQGNAISSGNASVKVGCPAILEVESRREQERTLRAYEKKRAMIKAKMKEY